MTEADREYVRQLPDRTIRDALADPRNLRELVAAVAPQLVDGLDFSRMRAIEREFRLEDWRGREADRLFEVPYREADTEIPVVVCILVEHQSTADPVMPLRMLVYGVLYWERQWKDWQSSPTPRDALRLNPMVPIVLHTGDRPWSTNRELSELMAGPDVLKAFAPHWPPLFWDVAEKTPQELLTETGIWLRSLAVVRAEREDLASFLAVFREILEDIERMTAGDEVRWHDLMRFVISWGLHRRPRDEADELKDVVAQSQREGTHKREVKAMSDTLQKSYHDLIAEAQAKAEAAEAEAQKGIEQGIEQGELRGRRAALKRVLERRFEDVPPDVFDRIDATEEIDRLQQLFDEALDAKSLEDLSL